MAASSSAGAGKGVDGGNTDPRSEQDSFTGFYTEVYALIDESADDDELHDALRQSIAVLLPNDSPDTTTLAIAITARLSQVGGLLEANGGVGQTRDLVLYLATRHWDLDFSLSPRTRTTRNLTSMATSQIPAEKRSDGKAKTTSGDEATEHDQAKATSVDPSEREDTHQVKNSRSRLKNSTLPQVVINRIAADAEFSNQARPPYVLASDPVPPVITDTQLIAAWNRASSARNTEIMIIRDRTRSEDRAEAFIDYDRNWAGEDNFPVYRSMKAFSDRHTLLRIEMVNIILRSLDLGHVTTYQDGLDLWNAWLLSHSLEPNQTEVGVGFPATTNAPTAPAHTSAQVETQSSTVQAIEDVQVVTDRKRKTGKKREQGNDPEDESPPVQKKPRRDRDGDGDEDRDGGAWSDPGQNVSG